MVLADFFKISFIVGFNCKSSLSLVTYGFQMCAITVPAKRQLYQRIKLFHSNSAGPTFGKLAMVSD